MHFTTLSCPVGDVLPCCVSRAQRLLTSLSSFSVLVDCSYSQWPALYSVLQMPVLFEPRCAAKELIAVFQVV